MSDHRRVGTAPDVVDLRDDRLRVVVGHHRCLLRESLTAAVTAAGAAVVGSVTDAPRLVACAQLERPDLVLAASDLAFSNPGGLADTVRTELGCRLLVLGRTADQAELLRALEMGADGFAAPTLGLDELGVALRRVAGGETYLPPGMLSGLLRELIFRRRNEDPVLNRFSRLSRREREVLALIVEGVPHAEMAVRLYLSPHTVRTHVQNVIEKLGVHSRVEAASMALEYDLLDRFAEDRT